jgi:hypothetical protein
MILPARSAHVTTLSFLLLASLALASAPDRTDSQSGQSAKPPLELSGLAWVEGNTFLAVHDSKNPDELDRPRISLWRIPDSPEGVTWKTVTVDWPPPLGPSTDLESIARIPGTDSFLLVESGEGVIGGKRSRRVFLVKVEKDQVVLESFFELPDIFQNIEGSAVARFGERLFFICAERGDHLPATKAYWTELQLRPFRFGTLRRLSFKPVGFSGRNKRPITAIEVDSHGRVFAASAHDPEDDNGPFQSVIWQAGRISFSRDTARVAFSLRPRRLATLDGLKVESLAIRERNGKLEIFAGTDDENYGGVIRPIALTALP